MPMFVRRIKDELYTPDNKEFVPSDKRERAYDIHRYGFSCNADVATNPWLRATPSASSLA